PARGAGGRGRDPVPTDQAGLRRTTLEGREARGVLRVRTWDSAPQRLRTPRKRCGSAERRRPPPQKNLPNFGMMGTPDPRLRWHGAWNGPPRCPRALLSAHATGADTPAAPAGLEGT